MQEIVTPPQAVHDRSGTPSSRTVVLDRAGVTHFLVGGVTAAAMVMRGMVPELKFDDTYAMHDALNALGGFAVSNSDGRTCALSRAQYVVFHESPISGKSREITTWFYGGHAAHCQELQGWGDEPDDPVIHALSDEGVTAEQFYDSYQATFVASGRGVISDSESHEMESPMAVKLVDALRSKGIPGVEVLTAVVTVRSAGLEADSNDVDIGATVLFQTVKGCDRTVASGPLRKAVDAEVSRMLEERSPAKVWANRFRFEDVTAVPSLSPVRPVESEDDSFRTAATESDLGTWGREP